MNKERLLKELMSELGKKGGKARAAALSALERKEAARKAALAKWEKFYQDRRGSGDGAKERG